MGCDGTKDHHYLSNMYLIHTSISCNNNVPQQIISTTNRSENEISERNQSDRKVGILRKEKADDTTYRRWVNGLTVVFWVVAGQRTSEAYAPQNARRHTPSLHDTIDVGTYRSTMNDSGLCG
ncbi:unnamed protein product [Citrullus colocynthis]|uniref:Uncharacterized protein n=1 Tax=Citrullus colocynthis TaxID=252529 RepID=A0ABP0Y043_9ROSI